MGEGGLVAGEFGSVSGSRGPVGLGIRAIDGGGTPGLQSWTVFVRTVMQEGTQAGFRVTRGRSVVSRFGMVVAPVGIGQDVDGAFQAIRLLFVAGVSSEFSPVERGFSRIERGFSRISQAFTLVVVVVRRLSCAIVDIGTTFKIP